MIADAALAELATALGPKGFRDDPEELRPALTDWRGIYHGVARAMLLPESVYEVRRCVEIAAKWRAPLVPQGGNTSMVGGATPPADGSALLISTRRLNRVRSIDAAAAIAVAEAGVILSNLHDAAADYGMRFPLTLGAKGSATIGGLTSTNAGGTQVLRFGTMRRLVLGVEAVLPDGSLHSGLSVLKKDTRGYDLDQLLVGAEGTLGIVTAVALRLVPLPVDSVVGWIGVDSPHAALRLLRWCEARSGDAIESFEVLSGATLALVVAHLPGARSPLRETHHWHVLIEYAGKNAREELEPLLNGALEAGLGEDAVVAMNEAQGAAFWRLRDSISEAERASGPAIQHDISVPVDAMPDFMIETAALIEVRFPGTKASAFGHLGDGNVHFHVRAPAMASDAVAAWRAGQGAEASRLVYDRVVAGGGSISAEHGIGQMKRGELARLSPPSRIMALRAIKAALDPLGIMNPGKLVPEPDAALASHRATA